MREIAAEGVRAMFEPATGHLPSLQMGGVEVLHSAPWRRPDPDPQAGVSRTEMLLAGDFFCAPFGTDDVAGDPLHGWPSCSEWTDLGGDGARARFLLQREVRGARIGKEIAVRDGHPALYQRHVIEGGQGRLSYAHHPMIRMAAGGRLTFSDKRAVLTDAAYQYDAGRALFALDQCREDFALATVAGGVHDLRDYPVGHAVEDFVICVEAGTGIGWTAVLRAGERDIVLVLKAAATLPVTMLWISNGGRDFPPWNGRHTGVLGIEDGCAAGATGLARAQAPNPVAATGVATTAELGGPIETRHAIVRVPAPEGWDEVTGLRVEADRLLIEGPGEAIAVPFDGAFLEL